MCQLTRPALPPLPPSTLQTPLWLHPRCQGRHSSNCSLAPAITQARQGCLSYFSWRAVVVAGLGNHPPVPASSTEAGDVCFVLEMHFFFCLTLLWYDLRWDISCWASLRVVFCRSRWIIAPSGISAYWQDNGRTALSCHIMFDCVIVDRFGRHCCVRLRYASQEWLSYLEDPRQITGFPQLVCQSDEDVVVHLAAGECQVK